MLAPITHVLGARPNFVKAAPVIRALAALGHRQRVVHTGQHYDERLSEVFFLQLGLPEPDVNLGVGSGSHAQQTAETMIGLEQELTEVPAGPVVVVGDVNSTVAAGAGGQEAGHRSRTPRPACAASTAPCRRRSTAGSPTRYPA